MWREGRSAMVAILGSVLPSCALLDAIGDSTSSNSDANTDGAPVRCANSPVFNAPVRYDAANSIAFAVDDVTGDSIPDVVVAVDPAGVSDVLVRNGMVGGTLDVPRQLIFNEETTGAGVLIADVDADGLKDVVVWYSTGLNVYRQNPATPGFFLHASGGAGIGPNEITSAALGNLDGDGRLDLLIEGPPGKLTRFMGQPGTASSFGTTPAVDTGSATSLIAFRDFDGDGLDDIHLARSTGSEFMWSEPPGSSLTAPIDSNANGGGVWGRFSADGTLVYATSGKAFLHASPREFVDALIPATSTSLHTVGDVNGDTRDDLVAADGVFLQCDPGGEQLFDPSIVAVGSPLAKATALADFNGDGKLDVAQLVCATVSCAQADHLEISLQR